MAVFRKELLMKAGERFPTAVESNSTDRQKAAGDDVQSQ